MRACRRLRRRGSGRIVFKIQPHGDVAMLLHGDSGGRLRGHTIEVFKTNERREDFVHTAFLHRLDIDTVSGSWFETLRIGGIGDPRLGMSLLSTP